MTRTRSRSIGLTAIACAAALAAVVPALRRPRRAPRELRDSQLVVRLDTQSDAAAGSVFYRLKLTNLSSHAPTPSSAMPGIVRIDLAGRQMGAQRLGTPLRNALSAWPTAQPQTATLRIVQALDFPSCHPAGG